MHRGHAQLTSTLGEPIDKLNRPGPCSPTLGYATKEKRLYNYFEKYLFYMYPRMYTCTLGLWQCHYMTPLLPFLSSFSLLSKVVLPPVME